MYCLNTNVGVLVEYNDLKSEGGSGRGSRFRPTRFARARSLNHAV